MMKRFFALLIVAASLVSCADDKSKVVINDMNPTNDAYNMSYDVATAVVEAKNYDEFKKARKNAEIHEEAFRTQAGGEAYLIFLEECNYMFQEL
jgi:hypothetical protein